ncbi:MAG: MCE family protein [Flavobacteriales bacterium]|nr:MCE family protein [Flavobacteriales bacterium]
MSAKKGDHIRLGLFVLAGSAVLVVGLYMLGSKRNLFSNTMEVRTTFHNAGGLRPGNNVRYAGINVGTVEGVSIQNDTTVLVTLMIREDETTYILDNAIASLGSDGLMGNKLVNIEPGDGHGEPLTDGVMLPSTIPLDTDAMLRTLDVTNDNLAAITADVRILSERLTRPGSVIDLFSDTALASQLRASLGELNATATAARSATEQVSALVSDVRGGKGVLGTLIGDPVAQGQVKDMLARLQQFSDSLASAAGEVSRFSSALNDRNGLANVLTQDTTVAGEVRRSIANLETGSETLNENLKALQRNWFFRKYFKEKERKRVRDGGAQP